MKLSIVTISRNAGEGLCETADAVLGQSHLPDEYLIQDGGSSDGSVKALIDSLHDRYFGENAETLKTEMLNEAWGGEISLRGQACELRIQSKPDDGIYDALNRAIARAQGDVIGLLHADDDYAHEDVLANVIRAFEAGAEVVYGDLQYVREARNGSIKVVRHWRSGTYQPRQLAWGWMPPHPALFVQRAMYERLALAKGIYFDPAYRCAGDYDFILRLFKHLTSSPVYLPEVLVRMRTGGISNRNVLNILRKSNEDLQAIRRQQAGGLHTLLFKNLRKAGQFRV